MLGMMSSSVRDLAAGCIDLCRGRAPGNGRLTASAVGGPAAVRGQPQALIERTRADGLIVAGAVHAHAVRLRSCERLAALRA